MIHANNTFQVISLNFHLYSMPTLNALITKITKKKPCMGPISFTRDGSLEAYFIGTAIPVNTNKEIPSKKPISLKRPTFVLRKRIILKCSNVWPVRQWRKRPWYGNENN
ncbi:hypothetical protein SAMN05216311_105230 [Chitinophaga sp. CF418]|nr:hypothetical protein SAMN05216311_105230 [Chitinophaga sp. CF418]